MAFHFKFNTLPSLFKGTKDPYRLTITNDETLTEVASFKLTKKSVYILFSSLFVGTVLLTYLLVITTPLRYYIPGYASGAGRKELIHLKQQIDSLNDYTQSQQLVINNFNRIVQGKDVITLDTNALTPKQIDALPEKNVLPNADVIKHDANIQVKAANRKKRHGRK
jgi:hypothetical protein